MEAYLGEIRLFPFDYAPEGWALCNGQLLQIQQNAALNSLLGTTFGGDGKTTFGLPDLRGRVPRAIGVLANTSVINVGDKAGVEGVTLSVDQIPAHDHLVGVTNAVATSSSITNAIYATAAAVKGQAPPNVYGVPGAMVALAADTIEAQGGAQPHDNMQPFMVVNFAICIADGIYPPRP